MLPKQRADLDLAEVADLQRLRLDVEGAATRDDLLLGARVNAVVAYVSDDAQDDALRKPLGEISVACTQLTQHLDQRVPHERIDLVDQQHEWTRVGSGPTG